MGAGVHGEPGMNDPLFSIVVPVHNRAGYLRQAVDSALAQEFDSFEVLVVDDGSTDGGADAIEALGDGRVRVRRLSRGGAPAARNAGVEMSRGRFIVWLDSDDYLEPGVLEAYAAALCECPKAEVIYGRIILANMELEPVRTIEFEDWHRRNRELLTTLLFRCPLPHPGTAVAKACYERVGGYDPRFRRAHDYEFWSRLALRAVFKYVRRPVCRWRWHDANMSAGSVNIDTSYELEVLKGILNSYGYDKLFGHDKRCEKIPKLVRRLRDLGDFGLAAEIETSFMTKDSMKTMGNACIGSRNEGE